MADLIKQVQIGDTLHNIHALSAYGTTTLTGAVTGSENGTHKRGVITTFADNAVSSRNIVNASIGAEKLASEIDIVVAQLFESNSNSTAEIWTKI